MRKTLVKAMINFYGIAFIAAGAAAIFLYFKIVAGAFVLIFAGVALLRRKAYGVYVVFFMAFVLAGIGLMFAGLGIHDILERHYKFDLLLMGLAPIIISLLTFYFFTRREVAKEFGLAKIAVLEKPDKKEIIKSVYILLGIIVAVGVVLLGSYFVAMRMAR